MKRLPVESSDIVSIGYDEPTRMLEIEFREHRIYQYLEVPPSTYEHFLKANSYGGYFNSHINSYYRYRRVDETGKEQVYDAIAFVTGNTRKFRDLQLACEAFDLKVERLDLPVDEIQSDDNEKIIQQKARRAYKLAGRPVVVHDAFWNILALRGFPGAYMKQVAGWLKPEDFLALLADKKDRSVSCVDTLMYYDGKRSKAFSHVYWGAIATEPRGKGLSIDQLVVMQGQTKTIAELETDEGRSSIDPQNAIWHDFAKWYNLQRRLHLV